MLEFLGNIATFIYLVPLFLGLSKYPFLSKRQKSFFIFMAISAAFSIAAYITVNFGNNLFLVYSFSLSEAIILPIFLLSAEDRSKYKPHWIGLTLVLISVIVLEAVLRDGGLSKWNNISLTLNSIALGALSIRLLIKLRFDPSIYNLAKSSEFWFALGLGIYHLGNLLFFAFARLLQTENMAVLSNLNIFRLFVLILSASIYIKGFSVIKTKSRGKSATSQA